MDQTFRPDPRGASALEQQKLSKKNAARVRNTLRHKKKLTAKIKLSASGAGGDTASRTLSIKVT
jgi:hypothetical protein